MRQTQKIYYTHQYARKLQATIVNINSAARLIELDRTIAYPEGGGQESDHCVFVHHKTGNTYKIDHAKKMYGRNVEIREYHQVNVEGIILHHVPLDEPASLDALNEGDAVTIELDTMLREKLTTSHSASHLLYVGVQKIRPDAIPGTIGCHIKDGQARFDFSIEERFSEQDIQKITEIANALIDQNCTMKTYPGEIHPDARLWECQENIIPCGGTHLQRTGTIGALAIRRKSIGRGKDRVICVLEHPHYNIEQYQEIIGG